jgi:hypothetical protein
MFGGFVVDDAIGMQRHPFVSNAFLQSVVVVSVLAIRAASDSGQHSLGHIVKHSTKSELVVVGDIFEVYCAWWLNGVDLRGNKVLLHKIHQRDVAFVKRGMATKLREIRRESIGSLQSCGALCASGACRCLAANIQSVANQNINVVVAKIRPIGATVDTSFNIRL